MVAQLPLYPKTAVGSLLTFAGTEAVFLGLFAFIVTGTNARSTFNRAAGLVTLCALTLLLETSLVPLCQGVDRPHWAATIASLLWVQYLSASELVLVSRVHAKQLLRLRRGRFQAGSAAVGLLWNMRRIRTPWQVKNVPFTPVNQNRASFVFKRGAVTLMAYSFVDAVVSMPLPEAVMVRTDKATLFSIHQLDVGDLIFRFSTTAGYWITTGILNFFMTNVGVIAAVSLGLSSPDDCPPLYGSFSEAYTIRRFWGSVLLQNFSILLYADNFPLAVFPGTKCSALS